MRRPFGLILPILVMCAGLPIAALALFGHVHVMPPMWVHFYGVGFSAAAAMAAAAAVTGTARARGTSAPSSSAAASRSWRRSSQCTGLPRPECCRGQRADRRHRSCDASGRRVRHGAFGAPSVRLGALDPASPGGADRDRDGDRRPQRHRRCRPGRRPERPGAEVSVGDRAFALGLAVYGALGVRAANTFCSLGARPTSLSSSASSSSPARSTAQ